MGKTMLFLSGLFHFAYLNGQQFYFTQPVTVPLENRTFEQTFPSCNSAQIYVCPPTNNIGQYPENEFVDIAIDANQNMYFVSNWGSLYRKNLNDGSACQYLGSFSGTNNVNALVVDDNGDVLGAGNAGGISTLYEYTVATQTFSTLGNFPVGTISSGDLFLYKGRVYLTAIPTVGNYAYILEVNQSNPSVSCEYLRFASILRPFSAFTLLLGGVPRVFVIDLEDPNQNNFLSVLHEVDMVNRTAGPSLCSYPIVINGAASAYHSTPPFIGSICPALPVHLLDFDLSVLNNMVTLNWKTTDDAYYFEIEKSDDGIQFSRMGRIDGSGDGVTIRNYLFIDKNPGPINYYRLKIVERDGSTEYSKIILARLSSNNSIKIIENPTSTILDIRVNVSFTQPCLVFIYDFTGRMLKTASISSSRSSVDISKLAAGNYVLKIIMTNGQMLSSPFTKTR